MSNNLPHGVKAKSLGFVEYVELLSRVTAVATDASSQRRVLLRERMKAQCGLTDEQINALAPQEAIAIKAAVDEAFSTDDKNRTPAKLISAPSANGVTEPIVVQLGDPIKMSPTLVVTELEFFAQTYLQLEDAIASDGANDRTVALLKIAKPLPSTLQTLPSSALSMISLSDGMFIQENVAPRFFDMPDN